MERKPTKISIIGAGAVGSSVAFSIATQRLVAEIVIIDVNAEKAEGEAMDISHGIITMGSMNIHSGSYADVVDSDLIIITAGVGRKPGETRLDLAAKNVAIARDVTKNLMKYYNGGAVMVISNPVDVITYLIQKESGLPRAECSARVPFWTARASAISSLRVWMRTSATFTALRRANTARVSSRCGARCTFRACAWILSAPSAALRSIRTRS